MNANVETALYRLTQFVKGEPNSFGDHWDNSFACQWVADLQDALRDQEAEIAKIKGIAATGTAESFLQLSDEQKRIWFAMSVIESSARKEAEARADRGNALMREIRDAGFYRTKIDAHQDSAK